MPLLQIFSMRRIRGNITSNKICKCEETLNEELWDCMKNSFVLKYFFTVEKKSTCSLKIPEKASSHHIMLIITP